MTTTEDATAQDTAPVQPDAWQAKQAAIRLNIPYRTVMRLISKGELETVKAGRYYLVPEWAIQKFLGNPAAS